MSANRYDAVLFDLDGTLVDSIAGIAAAMNAALNHFGFSPRGEDEFKGLIGEGLEVLVAKLVPSAVATDMVANDLIRLFREEYRHHWRYGTEIYPGVTELLNELTKRGVNLAVLSNKRDDFTRLIVAEYFSDWPFKIVRGASNDCPRKPDPEGALRVAATLGIAPACVVYLGDSGIDMETAAAAGMLPVGVLWGYRDAEELRTAGAQIVLRHPRELLEII